MPHYICTGGCKGVSDTEGTCQAADCPKQGQPLTACGCVDAQHSDTQDEETEDNKRA